MSPGRLSLIEALDIVDAADILQALTLADKTGIPRDNFLSFVDTFYPAKPIQVGRTAGVLLGCGYVGRVFCCRPGGCCASWLVLLLLYERHSA